MKRTLAVRVYNESGVLTRVASVFSSRGYNIDSIAVGSTETYGVSRIIIILPANAQKIEQVTNVLYILQWGLYIVILVFLVSISIIIYSIIGNFIYYYIDEIYITRLVWGSKVFIYGPFVLQWSIYSFISFILSLTVFIFVVQNVNGAFSELYFLHISYQMLFIEMVAFIFMWWVSGFFSSRKYLK